jgi:hypothetical protein
MTYGLHLGDDVSAMFLTAYYSADTKTLDYCMLQLAKSWFRELCQKDSGVARPRNDWINLDKF